MNRRSKLGTAVVRRSKKGPFGVTRTFTSDLYRTQGGWRVPNVFRTFRFKKDAILVARFVSRTQDRNILLVKQMNRCVDIFLPKELKSLP
jgi:hypothetical protein